MSQVTWDQVGARFYEDGVDRGVLYPEEGPGVAWNGLLSVQEKSIGGEVKEYYFEGLKYLSYIGVEEFAATIEALFYPDEFEPCVGNIEFDTGLFVTLQPRQTFGFSYRTRVGSDTDENAGYKLHLVYNALAHPTTKAYRTMSEQRSPSTFSWEITTTAILIPGARPTAHFIIDTTHMAPEAVAAIESIVYGTDDTDPRLPTTEELINLAPSDVTLTILDNGDGTWTAVGPDSVVDVLDAESFEIDSPSVTILGPDTFTVETL